VQSEIDFLLLSAMAAGTQIVMARAHVAHRVQVRERIAQTSGDGDGAHARGGSARDGAAAAGPPAHRIAAAPSVRDI
jgi:hypothetical protein